MLASIQELREKLTNIEKKAKDLGVVQVNFNKKKEDINRLSNIEEELNVLEYGLNYIESEEMKKKNN